MAESVAIGSGAKGQAELGDFIDPEKDYPVVVTTSRLLSTGVDAQTCRLIVLGRAVGSMTEFKQIAGRSASIQKAPRSSHAADNNQQAHSTNFQSAL
jgi:type I restriction enzyme R subunit